MSESLPELSSTAQPLNYSLIGKLVAASQVIGVGESTHGTHEFFDFKAKLFNELVTNQGFNTLLLEDSQEACQEINNYIAAGVGNSYESMRRLYPVWRVEEIRLLVEDLRKNYRKNPVQFVGFDINQTEENLKKREELMALNIINYVKANPKAKALAWAHNVHVKYAGKSADQRPMGGYLRKSLGRDYFAIGQFFGTGTFSATIINAENPDWSNRKLDTVTVSHIPKTFLEARLQDIDESNVYYLSHIGMSAFKELGEEYDARSLGWGLVPSQIDDITDPTNVRRDFSLITYFPTAIHSQPLT